MQSHRSILLPAEGPYPAATASTLPVDPASKPDQPQFSFDAATPIQTHHGIQRVDALLAGDRVLSRSGEFVAILEVERVHLTERQLHDAPNLAPIRFDPGALPDMSDGPAILVSPDCPIAWAADPQSIASFPARAFCDGGLIRWVIPEGGIHYVRLHFEKTQQLCVGGIWVELDRGNRTGPSVPFPAPTLVHDPRVFRPLLG